MIRSISKTLALAGATATLATVSFSLPQAKVGDTPSFTFRAELANGQGVKSLADLRGKPVLVDFWGTNCPPCVGFAVPTAVKLSKEYGDDLVVLFVECQGASSEKMEAFALKQRWLGNNALWTTERVFDLGLEGIPQSALLSPEGEIVVAGYTSEVHRQVEEKIAEFVKHGQEMPADTPKDLKKSWKTFAKGDYAKALAEARKVGEDPALAEAANATIATFVQRIERQIARAEWRIQTGDAAVALDELNRIGKAREGEGQLATRVQELSTQLAANKSELEAARELDRVEEKLFEEGPDEKSAKSLQRIAERFTDTKAGARAAHLAKLVEVA